MAFTLASFVIICVSVCGVFRFILWHLHRRRLYHLASKFDGPTALPIIGNAHLFVGSREYLLLRADELIKLYPSPCRVWFGPVLAFIVSDPEQVKVVCLSPKTLEKDKMLKDYTQPIFGTGLLTAPVPKWKVHRKLIQPTFNTKILGSFVEVFVTQSKIFTKQIERNLDGPEFKIFDLLSLCTLDMICETAMGVSVGAQINGNSDYVEALHQKPGNIVKRIFNFWLQPDFIFYRTKLGKDQLKNVKFLQDFTNNVIQIRKKEFLERNSQPGTADDEDDLRDSKPRRDTFLDLLIKLTYENGNLSDEALRDEVNTMILAGNDTSAVTLSFLMLMLASHPDVQDKVYEEIYQIYGDSDCDERPVLTKDLARMEYLERVLKETMRLFPIAPIIFRQVTEDLNIGEHILPTGSTVAIAILNLHRNEKYWPDPLTFNPERFLPEENSQRHPYSYVPFSGGPRNCIGMNYAMMSMKTLITTVLRRYILKKDDIVQVKDIRLKYEFVTTSVDPITVRIERRTRQ